MPYNVNLEEKIDGAVMRWKNVMKKKMFGGVCYLVKGNMAFGIWRDSLIVRVGKEQGEGSLKDRNVEPFNITGRPMSGWIMVKEPGWKSRDSLSKWIETGKRFALSLPEKKAGAKRTKTLKEYRA